VSEPLVRVEELTVDYPRGRRLPPLRALDRVSVTISQGETLGLVGESGSGKSTLGDAILGFAPAVAGAVYYRGEEILHARPKRRRELTRQIQVIFQNPYGSLNPAKTIGETLAEPLRFHRLAGAAAAREKVAEWLELVGMAPEAMKLYPSEFSGGQRQRIAIARALILEPELVVCDEVVSALDLSVQAQILNLLTSLKERLGVTYLFITHDMAVVEYMSDRIAVLHRGGVVEQGEASRIAANPADPYTQALIAAAPVPDPAVQRQRRRPTRPEPTTRN
jgi:peptide/nickel transport system ATP-binding protein